MAFWNWFSKKKEEDYETILSSLASDISKRQQKLSEIRLRERRATLLTTLYTLAAWLVYVSLWYFNYLPTHEGKGKGMRRVVLGVPVGVGPVVILFTRRIVQIWYQRKGDAEEKTLQNLRKTQRLKVEEIKKKTNYQSTHDLLRRYDESTASSPSPFSAGPTPARQQPQKPQPQKGQGQVMGGGQGAGMGSVPQTPMRPVVQMQNGKLVMGTPMTPVMPGGRMYVPTPQVPQHPPKKHWYDKLADALLGDDDSVPASSKYALICEKCFAHNGLVGEREREGVPMLPAITWVGWQFIMYLFVKDPLDDIPGPPVESFLKGNTYKLFNVNAWQFHSDIAKRYDSVVRFKAMFGKSYLYVADPKAMYHIFVKDQSIYERNVDSSKITLGEGLLGTLGDQHKKQRKMMNPVFSTVHMREMIPTFWTVSHQLRKTLTSKLKNGAQEIDMNTWMSRMALELIGQSGLGYSFDPLTEECGEHPYSVAVKQLVPAGSKVRYIRDYVVPIIAKLPIPRRILRWIVDIAPIARLHKLRDIVDVMYNTSVEILETKRKALEEGDEAVTMQVAYGKDIMSILLKANMKASEEDRLTEKELIGQMSTFIFAGMDTTSNSLSQILYLLSKHSDVQNNLRHEIFQRFPDDVDLTYDELESLQYLDAVCRETLRLHPPVTQVTRTCRKDMILPLAEPVKGFDGAEMYEIYVPKNTQISVSVLAANRNVKIWGDDALEWKPERWLAPQPSVKDARLPGIYSSMMTFIGGHRACIGFKFAQLEMKVVLVMILKSFRLSLSEKDIHWGMNVITTPSVVGGDPEVSSLPMIVSKYEESANTSM